MLKNETESKVNFTQVQNLQSKLQTQIDKLDPQEFKNLTIQNYWILKKYHKRKLDQNKQTISKSIHTDQESFIPNIISKDFKQLAQHWLKQTSASQAKFGLSLFQPSSITSSKEFKSSSDKEIMAKHISIETDQILDIYLSKNDKKEEFLSRGTLTHPKYFIAVDHKQKAVVLTIRGTLNGDDVITDLCGDAEPFQYMDKEGCFVHQGIYFMVLELYKTCCQNLMKSLKNQGEYKLVITGHSLGGGSSQIMYLLIKTKQFNNDFFGYEHREVQCWAFAPPPVFYPQNQLLPEHKKDIQVFINDNDIVPRLSVQGILDNLLMLRLVDQIDDKKRVTMKELYLHRNYKNYQKTKNGFNSRQENFVQKLDDLSKTTKENIKKFRWKDQFSCMFNTNSNAKEKLKQKKNDNDDNDDCENNKNKNVVSNFKQKFIGSHIKDQLDQLKTKKEAIAARIMLFKNKQSKNEDGGSEDQHSELNKLENEIQNSAIIQETNVKTYEEKQLQIEKKIQLNFIEIQKMRNEQDISSDLDKIQIPKMSHLGNVQQIQEDRMNKKIDIKLVENTENEFLIEILFDEMNDDHHMSGDYEYKFNVLLGSEKQKYVQRLTEIVEEKFGKKIEEKEIINENIKEKELINDIIKENEVSDENIKEKEILNNIE